MALNLTAPPEKSEKAKAAKPVAPAKTNGSLTEILSVIKKDKGDKVVVTGDTIPLVRRLPTGIFELDYALGGGFPCGRYSIVYGKESSNKTNICLKAVAAAQALPAPCNKVIWVNIEQTFDPVWAAKLGVKVSELVVVNAGYGEEAVDLFDALVRAEDVALIVVDSLAALIASREIAQSVENYDVATSAILIKRMLNKLMIAFCEEQRRDHQPCVLFINQTRYNLAVKFGDPEIMPGGNALRFLSSLSVRTSAKNVIHKPTSTLVFKETHVIVKKSKVPVRAVDFSFDLCVSPTGHLAIGETDSFKIVKAHLQALNLLTKDAKGWAIALPGQKKYPKLEDVESRYYTDKAFQTLCKGLVLKHSKDTLVTVEDEDFTPKTVPPGTVHPLAGEVD